MRYSYECKERVLNQTGKERIGNALLLDGEVIGGGGYIGQTAKRKGIYRLYNVFCTLIDFIFSLKGQGYAASITD